LHDERKCNEKDIMDQGKEKDVNEMYFLIYG
jgi:hypothetical protein